MILISNIHQKIEFVNISNSASANFTRAARRFADRAIELDNPEIHSRYPQTHPERIEREAALLDTSLVAVLTSYFAIEAAVNELYAGFGSYGLDPALLAALAAKWPDVERRNTIEKAKAALGIAKASIDWGSGVAQDDLPLLDALRDALVHHKPHSMTTGDVDDLERKLRGRFKQAQIWEGTGVSFRWAGCLGGGCARWAADTAVNFQRDFFGALGCKSYPSESVK